MVLVAIGKTSQIKFSNREVIYIALADWGQGGNQITQLDGKRIDRSGRLEKKKLGKGGETCSDHLRKMKQKEEGEVCYESLSLH